MHNDLELGQHENLDIFGCFCGFGGERRLRLLRWQALDRALEQNPDVLLARLDQQKARYQVRLAKDPFYPKVYGGGGYAWTNGYPVSIDGNPPSIFQARTDMALFDRQQSYKVAEAKEGLRGSAIDVVSRQEDAAYKVASLFLDAQAGGA